METTMVEMSKEFVPIWKDFEGLSDKDRRTIILLINNLSKKKNPEQKVQHKEAVNTKSDSGRIFITPEIKALEKGLKVPADISDDYKKELGDIRAERFL